MSEEKKRPSIEEIKELIRRGPNPAELLEILPLTDEEHRALNREEAERLIAFLDERIGAIEQERQSDETALIENIKKIDKLSSFLQEEQTHTIHYGPAASSHSKVIEAVEILARSCNLRCRTTSIKTGWLSRRTTFELTGERFKFAIFYDALSEWTKRNGIPVR